MRVQLCGFPVENVTMPQAIESIARLVDQPDPSHVSFVNAHYVNVASEEAEYAAALRSAELLFADGSGMRIAGRVNGVRLVDNVNGTDMFPPLARRLERDGKSVYLLGGRPGVAEGVARFLRAHAPRLSVCGWAHGYRSDEGWEEVTRDIRLRRPDVLLVALGAPLQEIWIQEWIDSIGVPVVMGVGGLFDFYSGRIPRAPKAFRAAGLEWAYRLAQEPRRMWRRYIIGNVVFLARAFREALRPSTREFGT